VNAGATGEDCRCGTGERRSGPLEAVVRVMRLGDGRDALFVVLLDARRVAVE